MCAHIITMNPYVCLIWEQKHGKEELKIHSVTNFLLFRGAHTVEEHVVDLVKYISKVNIIMREVLFQVHHNKLYLPTYIIC